MPTIAEKILSLEDYFAIEEPMEIRHEFVNGQLTEMPGESPVASEIASNLLVILKMALKGQAFKVYTHDVKLLIEHLGNVRYPDLVVVRQEGVQKKLVTQPVLIVEVLSDGTEKTDREEKLREYLAIPTLQTYLLVSGKKMLVEAYFRGEKRWEFAFFEQPGDLIELPDLGLKFTPAEIYEAIVFEDSLAAKPGS
ncbi:MAG: Uma2 family endonuclease [Cytophagaceae bacterium]|nr:Uma2 family endonuclease [Cytophagaceae bacterium]